MKTGNMAMIVLMAAVAAIRAAAAVVSQCECPEGVVADGSGQVLGWGALRGGTPLVPALTNSPAWPLPVLEAEGVSFNVASNPASPLAFASNAVATVFLAVHPSLSPTNFAALLEVPGASVTAVPRVVQPSYDPEDTAGLSVRVNGEPSLALPAAPHIVEVDFPQPVSGGELCIGGESACAAWRQQWRGNVAGVIAFGTPPDEAVRRVVRSYLARRHGIAGDFSPPGGGAVLQAMEQGVNLHGLFSTRLFLK